MSLSPLLHTIADGEFHSGEELARLLGVSRTAVWKQLQKIQLATGLQLESVKGRGYRLRQTLELLDRERIVAGAGP
ncbi:MAG: HTH domain-containing protein, partial [Spongiibacteraceae bacterium]